MTDFWQKSKCVSGFLHKFELVRIHPYAVEEVCERCKQRHFFRTVNGKFDNTDYLSYHLRSALQPYHPNFKKEYER